MEDKSRVIITMRKLSKEINKYHPNTETAKFVDDTLSSLQRSEGVAFTGCLQYFFNKISVVKFSEDITFNESEKNIGERFIPIKN